jgi:hypothetical protein
MNRYKSRWEELTTGMSHGEREDLEARLRDMQGSVNICTVLTFFAFFLLCHYILLALSNHLTNSDPDAMLAIPYQPAIWWFFPAVGGLTMAWELTLQFWSLFGHRKAADQYREIAKTFIGSYRGQLGAYQVQIFMRWSALLLALPIGVLTLLALNMHTSFEAQKLRECGYAFRPCELHPYSEVRSITHVSGIINSHGHYIERPNVVVVFRDGYRWNSSKYEPANRTIIGKIESLLTQRTGLPLESVAIESAIP